MLIILKTCWKIKFVNYLEERSILILYTANFHFSITDQVPQGLVKKTFRY